MFDNYIYIIKVFDNDETYEYEYGNLDHAQYHFNREILKGNNAVLYRYNNGTLERCKDKWNINN